MRAGQTVYAGGDVDRDAADIVVEQLAFAGVQARTDLQSELVEGIADGGRTADAACGAIESGEEAVSGAFDLPSAEAVEFPTDGAVVPFEQFVPASVAQGSGALSRV